MEKFTKAVRAFFQYVIFCVKYSMLIAFTYMIVFLLVSYLQEEQQGLNTNQINNIDPWKTIQYFLEK